MPSFYIDELLETYDILMRLYEKDKLTYTKETHLRMTEAIDTYWQKLLVIFKSEEIAKKAIVLWKLQNST